MKRLLMGLMLAITAGAASAASAEWTAAGGTGELIQYVDRATIRKSGNLVKMWDSKDYLTVQKSAAGESYLSRKAQEEYDCKEEKSRTLAYASYDKTMGDGKVVTSNSNVRAEWEPNYPGSLGETQWKIACGKKL